jgi:hypothetical protein
MAFDKCTACSKIVSTLVYIVHIITGKWGVQRYTNYAMLGRWCAKIYKVCYVGEMVCKDIQIMLCWGDGIQRYTDYAMLGRWYTKIYKLCYVGEMVGKDMQSMLCWGDGIQRYTNYAMLGRWYTKIYKL